MFFLKKEKKTELEIFSFIHVWNFHTYTLKLYNIII